MNRRPGAAAVSCSTGVEENRAKTFYQGLLLIVLLLCLLPGAQSADRVPASGQ